MRLLLSIAVVAGMVALCIIGWPYGGAGGLIGGALGFLIRLGGRRLDWNERLGTAYVGALMGLPVGFLVGGFITMGLPYILTQINAPQ